MSLFSKYKTIILIMILFIVLSFILTVFQSTARNLPIIRNPIIYSLLLFSGVAAAIATVMTVFEQLQNRAVKVLLRFIGNEVLQGWIVKFLLFMFLFLLGLLGYSWLIPNPFNNTQSIG